MGGKSSLPEEHLWRGTATRRSSCQKLGEHNPEWLASLKKRKASKEVVDFLTALAETKVLEEEMGWVIGKGGTADVDAALEALARVYMADLKQAMEVEDVKVAWKEVPCTWFNPWGDFQQWHMWA